MAAFTSTQAGPWNDSATWGGGGVPGDGDTATIDHAVSVTANQTVGDGTTGGGDSFSSVIVEDGPLTIEEDIVFTIKGDLRATHDITLEAGSALKFDTNAIAKISHAHGSRNAALYCNGTLAKPCLIEPVGLANWYHHTPEGQGAGSSRIVAYHTTFRKFGDDAEPDGIHFFVDTTDGDLYPWIAHDCTFDQGMGIAPCRGSNNEHDTRTGRLEFLRCKWTNSVAPDPWPNANWGYVNTQSFPGMTCSFKHCDFDGIIAYMHPDDWITEDCVFRDSFFRRPTNAYTNGAMGPMARCFTQFNSDTGPGLQHGDSFTDCYFLCIDTGNNPHFHDVAGMTGVTLFERCMWKATTTAVGSEGDGVKPFIPDSGTQSENVVYIKNCITLPNGNGPDATSSITATAATFLHTLPNVSVEIEGCTLFVGNSLGAFDIGETNATVAGNAPYFRSNLVIGHPGLTGKKVDDLGFAVNGTVTVGAFDYNGSWRIPANSGGPGNGYDAFLDGGGSAVTMGANDVDDEDPGFVDWTRDEVSWAGSVAATIDRVSFTDPAFTILDFLDYIREGWRPTNEVFKDAGDPARGTPQIGAVPFLVDPTAPDTPEKPIMELASANAVLSHSSAYHYRLSTHSWTRVVDLVNGTAQTYDLGVVIDEPTPREHRAQGLATLDIRASAALAAGESLNLQIFAYREDGTSVKVYETTVDSTALKTAGTTNVLTTTTPTTDWPIHEGDTLVLRTDYTAGGTPADPTTVVVVQIA